MGETITMVAGTLLARDRETLFRIDGDRFDVSTLSAGTLNSADFSKSPI